MCQAIARASLIHTLPGYLEQFGICAEPVFRQAGMGPRHMAEPVPVRRAQLHAALGLAARAAGMVEMALTLGAGLDPGRLGPPALALLAGPTLEAGLRGYIALMPRLQTDCEIRLRLEGQQAQLWHCLAGDDSAAWLLHEGMAAFHVQSIAQLVGAGWAPELVSFPHACRGRQAVYEAHFGCPVRFGVEAEVRITFPKGALASARKAGLAGQPAVSPGKAFLFERFCPLERARFDPDGQLILAALRSMIAFSLPVSGLTIVQAAARLGLSSRTLQRRLMAMGTRFEALIDEQRRLMAQRQLAEAELTITDIAMQLGYSDAAHFNRAFRRWEDCSPSDYRQKQRPAYA